MDINYILKLLIIFGVIATAIKCIILSENKFERLNSNSPKTNNKPIISIDEMLNLLFYTFTILFVLTLISFIWVIYCES